MILLNILLREIEGMNNMKTGTGIFTKSFLSLFIETVFFSLYIVGWVFGIVTIDEKLDLHIPRGIIFVGLGLFILYLLLSNIRYKSLGALICKYEYAPKAHKILATILENIIFYGFSILIVLMQIKKVYNFFYYSCILLFTINMLSCFIPKIRTRLSLYLLKIEFKDSGKKVKRRNNGIVL